MHTNIEQIKNQKKKIFFYIKNNFYQLNKQFSSTTITMGRMGRRAPLASGEYEVEEIVGKYSRRGTIYYHVKWKGFPE